jgi:uncharacterized protein YkwD
MRYCTYAFKALLLSGSIIAMSCSQGATTSSSMVNSKRDVISLDNMETGILQEVNAYRKKIGKPALQMMDAASAQAAIHSRNMAQQKTAFGHDGFETRVANIRKQATAININAAAENVAFGELTAQKVVDGWLHSPGHKKNIEGDYNLTGIGVSRDKNGRVYYTQIFLHKQG